MCRKFNDSSLTCNRSASSEAVVTVTVLATKDSDVLSLQLEPLGHFMGTRTVFARSGSSYTIHVVQLHSPPIITEQRATLLEKYLPVVDNPVIGEHVCTDPDGVRLPFLHKHRKRKLR